MVIERKVSRDLFQFIKAISEDVLLETSAFADTAAWRALIMEADHVPVIGVMGEFSAGKSTFINALLGEEILQSDVLPTTAVVTFIRYGENAKVLAYDTSGASTEHSLSILSSLTAEGDEGAALRASIQYVELQLPNERLKKMTLVDTPGFNAGNELHTARSEQALSRLDDAVWLFMFGLVGKESERQAIQSLRERTSITPLGIINGIDKAEQYSSEALDPIKYALAEERKLSGYVRGMIGVSSLDALQSAIGAEHSAHWWELSRFGPLLERLDEDHREDESVILSKRLDRLADLAGQLTGQIERQMEQDRIREHMMQLTSVGEQTLDELQQAYSSLHETLNKLRSTGSEWDELLSTSRDSFVQHWIGSILAIDRNNISLKVLSEASLEVARSRHRLELDEKAMLAKRREAAAKHRKALGQGAGRIKALVASKSAVYRVRSEWEASESLYTKYAASRSALEAAIRQLAAGFEPLVPRIEQMLEQRYGQLQNEAVGSTAEYRNKYEHTAESMWPMLGLFDRYASVRRLQLKLGDYLSELEPSGLPAGEAAYEALLKLRQTDVYTDVAYRIRKRLMSISPDGVDSSGIERRVPPEWKELARGALERDLVIPDSIEISIRRPVYWKGKLGWSLLISIIVFVIANLYYPGPVHSQLHRISSQVSHWFQSVLMEGSMDDPAEERERLKDKQPDRSVPLGYVVVKAVELNVRTTYSTSGEIVRKLSQGERADVIGEMNGWLQIGKNEWISGSDKYVQYTQLEESPS